MEQSLAQRRNLAMTFAGGGNRAFYQLGFLHVWGERLLPRTQVIATCSAGACVATIHLSERENICRSFWRQRRSGVTRNLQWSRLLRGKGPAPHAAIYRDTLLCAYAEGGLEKIRNQPFPILVLTALPPRRIPLVLGAFVGASAYNLEKRLRPGMVHPSYGKRLGFEPMLIDARSCETPEELADLILASSATPPFTPIGTFRGHRLLDGGMIDNVPAAAAEGFGPRGNLVLLTRPYPAEVLGPKGKRLYVAPSKPTPVSSWDYTNPDLVDATVEMGEREAEHHRPSIEAFLAR